MASEEPVMEELQALQKKLGKKQAFEEAVSSILSLLRDRYSSSSPSLRKSEKIWKAILIRPYVFDIGLAYVNESLFSTGNPHSYLTLQKALKILQAVLWSWPSFIVAIYSTVCRVATVLQTRYTAPGFWLAGLRLFEEAEGLVSESSEKEHMKKCIARAREHLHEMDNEVPVSNRRPADSGYLFEGHLTVDSEPAPPAWLVAQNLLTTLAVAQDWTSIPESSRGREENNDATENARVTDIPESVRELINNMQEITGSLDLDSVIEASLQEIGAGLQRPPPASKAVVANLPVINVTEEVIAGLGGGTYCAVCQENFVIDDKLQELPCKHLFHPPCLKPWLDEHNSCPICRHELRTDDHAYESWKEREREAEEDRKGAENAVRGGEYMYV